MLKISAQRITSNRYFWGLTYFMLAFSVLMDLLIWVQWQVTVPSWVVSGLTLSIILLIWVVNKQNKDRDKDK